MLRRDISRRFTIIITKRTESRLKVRSLSSFQAANNEDNSVGSHTSYTVHCRRSSFARTLFRIRYEMLF